MPTCTKCGITQATVEMRRSPKKDAYGMSQWLCKQTEPCKQRRIAARAHQIAVQKGK
jgi:hypothetical protein